MGKLRNMGAISLVRQLVIFSLVLFIAAFSFIFVTTRRSRADSSQKTLVKKRMEERVSLLKHACQRMPVPSKIEAEAMDGGTRLITQVLEDHHLMVCVVYKAGSSTWTSLVAHRYNNSEILKTGEFYKMIKLLRPTKERFQEVSRSSLFLKVVMARHPLERLLSAYRNRIQDQTHFTDQAWYYAPLILRHTRGIWYTRKDLIHINGTLRIVPTFREFVSYLVSQPPQEYDDHWKPVSLLCGPCHINYTAIVLTETFNEDMHYIMSSSGMDHLVSPSLLNKNINKGEGNTNQLLAEYYSTLEPLLLHRIIDVYRNDFKMFNYTPDKLLSRLPPATKHMKDH